MYQDDVNVCVGELGGLEKIHVGMGQPGERGRRDRAKKVVRAGPMTP